MTILSKQYPMDLGTGTIEQVNQSAAKIDNEFTAIYGHLNNIRTRYRGATAPTNPEAGQLWEDSVNAKVMKWNGSAWVEDVAKSLNLTNRNTVLQGQVSSVGALELILGSTSALTADLVSSAIATIIAIPAGHDDVMGNSDYIVSFSATQTDFWTSLPANNTSHLFVDYAAGTVTGVYSVIAPVYQSYAPAHASGKHWYDTNKEQWYLSSGSAWTAVYRCYVGSVVTDGTKVTATTIEPYNVIRLNNLDTDGTLAANSDSKIATQKAVKAYIDANGGTLASVASAATCDIGAAAGNFVTITGTTTITALGTVQAGTRRHVRFAGALTLTHNATSLILPGGANITTAAGDTATFVSLGSGNWVCVQYQRADGQALIGNSSPHGVQVFTSTGTFTVPNGVNEVSVTVVGGGGAGGGTSSGVGSGGGGGGGDFVIDAPVTGLTPGTAITVTVGNGGAVANGAGGAGGTSSFGAHVSKVGGGGGAAASASSNGGTATGNGTPGGRGFNLTDPSLFFLGSGGSSAFGGTPGFLANNAYAGVAAKAYGAGGTGSSASGSPVNGGAGAKGIVIVRW